MARRKKSETVTVPEFLAAADFTIPEALPSPLGIPPPPLENIPFEATQPISLPQPNFSDRPKRQIAILGSAISSVNLAPFHEPDWEIWGCSPANKFLPRVDVWFELHNPVVKETEGLIEWLNWLKERPIVYMQQAYPGYKGARIFPVEAVRQAFGPYWWTSQIAYMLALAIMQKPYAIGLFGVDMAATSEYNQQRLACQFFIWHILKNTDIKLMVPPESDILEAAPLYGYCESSRQWRKYRARELELRNRIRILRDESAAKTAEANHLVGAVDDMEYQLAHWANRMDFE